MRTLAHELVHYKQDVEHKIGPDSGETGSPIENEANALAGQIMRRFDEENPELFALKPAIP
jgi:Zn-dependent peptidase ImmA (M78 family)